MTLKRSPVTAVLLLLITAIFLLEWLMAARGDQTLFAWGAILGGTLSRGEYWRLVTGMFLHAGFLHWLANSWTLYQLGTLYEAMFGSARFTATYFVSGIVASAVSSIFLPPGHSGVGASGAILGILGAFFFSIRRSPQYRHQPWTKNLLSQLFFWAAVNILLGFSVPGIDNVAHIAGLVSGVLLGLIPHRVPPPPPSEMIIDARPIE